MFIILNKSAYLSVIIYIIRPRRTDTQVFHNRVNHLGILMMFSLFIGKKIC